MRHRPGILRKLARSQCPHILDPLDGARLHVRGEFLVPEDRETFFQGQLEPVLAGNPIAGPVVKILVADDALDALVIGVGRRLRARQHILGVEDVKRLVLHRAHVEVVGRNDVVNIEVVLQPEALFVPFHRADQ